MAPSTIRYDLSILKRGFRLAKKANKAIPPEFPSIEVCNTRSRFFEEEQFIAVRSRLPEALQPLATFAYLTGWRMRSEIQTLQWPQVDFKAGIVRLEPGAAKNKEARLFPFSVWPELAEVLRSQRERTTALEHATGSIIPWVFHRNGRPIKDIRKAWKNACRDAGFPGMIPHDFRRTAVRRLEQAGVPRKTAMRLVGHKTESIYQRYMIVVEKDLVDAVKKLAATTETELSVSTPPVITLGTIRAQFRHNQG